MQHTASKSDTRLADGCPVEAIAQAYLTTTHGDVGVALRCAITDALADLLEAERRTHQQSRLISRGYVRARLHDATDETA